MAEPFDPYRKWLGIPPAEQPPDHYRLLGIGRFEDDADTISNAADRQMAHVRTFQTGPRSALSQKLLNEIAAARVCLLNPAQKAKYDRDLQAKIAAAAPAPRPSATTVAQAPVVQSPVEQFPPGAPALSEGFPNSAMPEPRPISVGGVPGRGAAVKLGRAPYAPAKKKSPVLAIAVVGACLLAVVAVVLALRGGQDHQPLAEQPETIDQPIRGEAIEQAPPTVVESTDADKLADAARPPKLEIVKAEWGAGERWQDITARVRSLVDDERLLATAWGSFFQDVRDPEHGLPKHVRIEYRAAGEPGTLHVADTGFIYLDGRPPGAGEPSAGGLEVVEARYGVGATWIDVLPRLRRWVHDDRLAVRVELVAQADPAPGERKALFLRYRTPDGEFIAHAWDSQVLALDARPAAAGGKPVDLIARVDTSRDSTGGAWSKAATALVGPDREPGNLAIHAPMPEEYLLTAVIDASPRPDSVGITLPIGDRQVQVVLDGWSSSICALQNVDGAAGNQNATTRHGSVFEAGQATMVRCAVRRSSIRVTCNGRVAIDWRGDPASLSAPAEALAADGPAIVVRSLGKPWRLTRLDVAPLRAESSHAAPAASGEVVDLLKLIDPERDAVAGDWRLTDEGLLSPIGGEVRLQVPVSPPEDYELRLTAARISGSDSLSIGLLVDGHQTAIALDRFDGTQSGMQRIDGENTDRNCTIKQGRVFSDEQPKEVICVVHPNSVRVTGGDRVLVDWHGDAQRLSLEPHLNTPDAICLLVNAWNTEYRISKYELRPLPPEPPTIPTELARPVDVLKRIDLSRDVVYGEWKKEGGTLIAPATQWARMQLPVIPPEEYTLTIEAIGNRDVVLGIVVGARRAEGAIVGGRQVEVALDGWNGATSGMQNVDGKGSDQNATTHQGKVLRDDAVNTIVCTVLKNHVDVACNGMPVISWQGDPRSLSLPHSSMMPDDRRPFLRSWDQSFRITRLELSAAGAVEAPSAPAPTEKPRSLADLLDQPSAATDSRLPVPDGGELTAAEQKVEATFAPQWKTAKKFVDRLALVRKIYDTGLQTTDSPAERYALLREASHRAATLGDAATACDAVERLGREFQIDPLVEKADVCGTALQKARQPAQISSIAMLSLLLVDRALGEARFDEGRKLASLAAAAARRTHHHDLIGAAEHRQVSVRRRQELHAEFEAALARLGDQPDDAEANRTAGVYLCLVGGEWQRGLERLARSGDARLAEMAKLEAVAGQDPSQRAALVDAWLATAETLPVTLRTECELQAKYWYDRGLPAEALTADRLRSKAALEKLPASGISHARVRPGLDMAMFDGGDFQQFRARRVDAQIYHNFGFGSPDPAVPGDNFSIRWTGWLKPPAPGKYVLKTNSDDSVRVRINGKLVIDHWSRGAGDEIAEVELNDGFQPLSVEYNDYQANADIGLRWALKDISELHVVPPEAYYYDPAIVP